MVTPEEDGGATWRDHWELDPTTDDDMETVLKAALDRFCQGPSYEQGINVLQLVDHALAKRLVSLATIENAVGALLQLLNGSDGERSAEYTVVVISRFTGHLADSGPVLRQRLWDSLQGMLKTSVPGSVRVHCLQTLCQMAIGWRKGQAEEAQPTGEDCWPFEKLLTDYLSDFDHRVRRTSLDCLLMLHQAALPLHVDSYEPTSRLVEDADEAVRLRAFRMLAVFAKVYAERPVPSDFNRLPMRLVDHAFSKICYAMQDTSVANRIAAAELLGQLENVSDKFLEQTLDKKLLKSMKTYRDSKADAAGQEWSSGRLFAKDAPADLMDGSYIPLIDSQACGAFVAGLEDEHMDVRNASINAVSALASRNKEFAQKCLDFLVDMFNDEIDEVRLNAINHLAKLCPYVTITDEQLQSIYNGLVDSSKDGREAIRKVLACCRLESSVGLKNAIDALLSNLVRNPEDKVLVWQCAKELGSKLSGLVLPLVGELLSLHPYFESVEPKLNDIRYITKLIIIFNAADHCSTIRSLFLGYTWRHYEYLRAAFPTLVPDLNECNAFKPPFQGSLTVSSTIKEYKYDVDMAMDFLKHACALPFSERVRWFGVLVCNLERLGQAETNNRNFYACTVDCLRLVMKLYEALEMVDQSPVLWNANVVDFCREILIYSMKIPLVWKGNEAVAQLSVDIQLRAAMLLTFILSIWPNCSKPAAGQRLDPMCLYQFAVGLTAADVSTFESMVDTTKGEVQWKVSPQQFIADFKTRMTDPIIVYGNVVHRKACIVEPRKDSKEIRRFAGSLAVSVPFEIHLFGFDLSDASTVHIRLNHPDGRTSLSTSKGDVTDFSPDFIRIRTDVIISEPPWTDPAAVVASVVLLATNAQPLDTEIRTIAISDSVPVVIYPRKV